MFLWSVDDIFGAAQMEPAARLRLEEMVLQLIGSWAVFDFRARLPIWEFRDTRALFWGVIIRLVIVGVLRSMLGPPGEDSQLLYMMMAASKNQGALLHA